MEPTKALEILIEPVYQSYRTVNQDFPEALNLGIEALKRVRANRFLGKPLVHLPLPGETPSDPSEPSPDEKKRLQESPLGEK